MNIIVGTESSIKISAMKNVIKDFRKVKLVRGKIFITSKKANHDLPNTPFEDETFTFAQHRVQFLYDQFKDEGDLFIGVESGIIKRHGTIFEECWCVILDQDGNTFSGYSSGLTVPQEITERLEKGEKHHEILGSLYKGDTRETWSIYTNGVILREKSIEEAFRNAFYYAIK